MCGIFAYSGEELAAPILISGLAAIQYRGYDSAGIATFHNGKIYVSRCVGDVSGLSTSLPGKIGIGHTRWATTGKVSIENAHPHLDCTGNIAVVHNGNIKNAAALRAQLIAKGHVFKSETDSEVIAHLLEEGSSLDVLEGDYAIAWIQDGKVLTASRGMSLIQSGNCCSSCPQESADIGGFKHWMRKEIQDQLEGIKAVPADFRLGARGDKVLFVGCGSSYHAALIAKTMLFCRAEHIGEFSGLPHIIVALSQSGETSDVLLTVRWAKTMGSKIVGITNCKDSALAQEADHTILLNQGSEISVASTKTFTAMLQAIKCLAGDSSIPDIQSALNREDEIREIASSLRDRESILILGSGIHYPIALEAALKLKEVCYVHAEGIQASELKHGPLALVTEGYPVIVLHGTSAVTIHEIEARGGRVIQLAHQDVIVETVMLQLLAYHLGVIRGCAVDRPRNLAKSVTVS